MGLQLVHILALHLVLLALASTAKSHVFDVTSAKYGAKPGSDITAALAKAWTDACGSPSASKVVVPKGTFKLTEADFQGPCKAPIELQVQGTLQASTDSQRLTKKDTWVGFTRINMLTISGGGIFDGQGKLAWTAWSNKECHKNVQTACSGVINLRFYAITNSKIVGITSKDSKNFHVNVVGCNNVTFEGFTISAPEDSPNTDGIHIGRSVGINITDTNIGTGDDCISIGDGSKQITATKVTCGPGHGISIGSLGRYPNEEPVEGIAIKNCTISNTSNGLRIKTWPASPPSIASNMHFEDIVVNNVGNPILIDQQYCPWNKCTLNAPSKVKISDVSFKNIRGTSSTPLAVKLVCSAGLPCEKVELAKIDIKYTGTEGPLTSQCSNVKPTLIGISKDLACATTV